MKHTIFKYHNIQQAMCIIALHFDNAGEGLTVIPFGKTRAE